MPGSVKLGLGIYQLIWYLQKSFVRGVNHVLSMLLNLSLAIRYCTSLPSGPNLMVLVKGLPTYTCSIISSAEYVAWSGEEEHCVLIYAYLTYQCTIFYTQLTLKACELFLHRYFTYHKFLVKVGVLLFSHNSHNDNISVD